MSMVAKYSVCAWFNFNNYGAAFHSFLLRFGQWILISRKCSQPWITSNLEAILDVTTICFTCYRRSGKFQLNHYPVFSLPVNNNLSLVSQSSNQKILWTSAYFGYCRLRSFCSTRICFQMDPSMCSWSNHNCLCPERFRVLPTPEVGTHWWIGQ